MVVVAIELIYLVDLMGRSVEQFIKFDRDFKF